MIPNPRYELSARAERQLRKLDEVTRRRIVNALKLLVADPPQGDVKKLEGTDDEWRLRVGAWRVRFFRDVERDVIYVLQILPRDRAYRD